MDLSNLFVVPHVKFPAYLTNVNPLEFSHFIWTLVSSRLLMYQSGRLSNACGISAGIQIPAHWQKIIFLKSKIILTNQIFLMLPNFSKEKDQSRIYGYP